MFETSRRSLNRSKSSDGLQQNSNFAMSAWYGEARLGPVTWSSELVTTERKFQVWKRCGIKRCGILILN